MRILTALVLLSISACGRVAFAQTAQFPGAIATDANLKVAVNGVNTLLTATITSGTLTTSVSSCAGIVANVLVTIDSEIMPVSGCSGTVISFNSRGFDGTTAAAHSAGATINAFVDAWYINALRVETEAIENGLGVSLGNVVSSSAVINPAHGGTGVNNGSSTLTLAGNTTFSGAFNPTLAFPSSSTWTFPAAGTLIGSNSAGAVTNSLLAGSITAAKLVGTDIATVGTITSGTWDGTVVSPAYGGTGVNNGSSTLTLGGNAAFSGAYTFAGTLTGNTAVTFPTSGTLVGSADTGTVTNTMLAGSITNAKLSSPVAVTSCGSSASCAAPAVKSTGAVVNGTIAFSSSTTATITGIPGFTSATSFSCWATDPTHTYTWVVQNVSASSITITAGTSNSDTWGWECLGW